MLGWLYDDVKGNIWNGIQILSFKIFQHYQIAYTP